MSKVKSKKTKETRDRKSGCYDQERIYWNRQNV